MLVTSALEIGCNVAVVKVHSRSAVHYIDNYIKVIK